ncbi:MAG: hypothetical protein CMH56_04365 [Myxococcales bacterium]|nr:hypothetical protein [Myxococcales bacterium]
MGARRQQLATRIKLADNWRLLPAKSRANWRMQAASGTSMLPATLPGPWQMVSGLENHFGMVVYQNEVDLKIPKGQYATLKLSRACYQTRVLCNDRWVGKPEAGYFQTRWIHLPNAEDGSNVINIEVTCEREKDLTQKKQILGIFSHWDMLPADLNPGGIHDIPEIWVHGPVLPTQIRCFAEQLTEQEAHVVGEVDLFAHTASSVWLKVGVWPLGFDAPVAQIELPYQLKVGKNTRLFSLSLEEPRRWWPKGMGDPNLYRIEVTVTPDKGQTETLADVVGFRTVEMSDYQFRINGEKLFLRGTNLAPVAPYLSHMTSDKLDSALDHAEAFNVNLLRVHCHVLPQHFYREADRRGMLVWQDMPLQWLYHPKTLPEIRRQGRRLSKYIYNHPSVILFCCANEPIYMEDTGKVKVKQTILTLWNFFGPSHMRDVIAKSVWRDLKKKDTTRIYLQSSGELDTPLAEGGDTHLYAGWYPAFGPVERFDWFAEKMPKNIRFVSEFGAQSLPNIESARAFLPEDLTDAAWKKVAASKMAQIPNMKHWVDLDACQTLEDLVEVTQRCQLRVSRYIIDRLRFYKYSPAGGFTHFLLNETILGVTWSVVDATGVPKDTFKTLSNSLMPANIFLLPGEEKINVGEMYPGMLYGVNDEKIPVHLAWRVSAVHQSGEILEQYEGEVFLEPDSESKRCASLGFVPAQEGFVDVTIDITRNETEHQAKHWRHVYRVEVLGPQRKKVGKLIPDRLRQFFKV